MRYPTRFQQKTLWNAITGLAMLVVGTLIVGLIWLIGEIFGFLQPVLIPLIVAGIVAYVLDPVVRLLEKRRFNRLWAVITVYIIILTGIMLLVSAVEPGIQRGHETLKTLLLSHGKDDTTNKHQKHNPNRNNGDSQQLGNSLPRELADLRKKHADGPIGWLLTEKDDKGNVVPPPSVSDEKPPTLDSFAHTRAGRILFEYQDVIFSTAHKWVSAGSTRVLGFLGLVLGMLMVPVYLFFFLKESAAIRAHWHDYVPLKASRFKTELVDTLQEINGYLVSFFRGQVLVAMIDGILVGIALTIFGLPYGFIIGIFMAILGVIPYVGNILCLIPACIIGYLYAQDSSPLGLSPWTYVGCVLGIFVVVQQINSLITAPKIVGDSVGLHPLTVIFSMLFWSLVLGGFVGALLAVPLTAAVKVLFRRYIWERQLRDLPESSLLE